MTRLAFITGASSGIGQALAWRYHQAGWRLALVARRSGEIVHPDRLAMTADPARELERLVSALVG